MSEGRRKSDLTLHRLEDMVYEAQKLANESRAEFRAVRQEIMGELRVLRFMIDGDPLRETKGLKQRVDDLKTSFDNLKDNRTIKLEKGKVFWTSITAVAVQVLFLAALLVLNWERVEVFFKDRFKKSVDPVEMVLQRVEKPKHRRRKKPLPPIVVPEVESEPGDEEMPKLR